MTVSMTDLRVSVDNSGDRVISCGASLPNCEDKLKKPRHLGLFSAFVNGRYYTPSVGFTRRPRGETKTGCERANFLISIHTVETFSKVVAVGNSSLLKNFSGLFTFSLAGARVMRSPGATVQGKNYTMTYCTW